MIDVNINKTETTKEEQQKDDSNDAYEKLKKLKKMLDEGLITEDEYKTKKAKILESM